MYFNTLYNLKTYNEKNINNWWLWIYWKQPY